MSPRHRVADLPRLYRERSAVVAALADIAAASCESIVAGAVAPGSRPIHGLALDADVAANRSRFVRCCDPSLDPAHSRAAGSGTARWTCASLADRLAQATGAQPVLYPGAELGSPERARRLLVHRTNTGGRLVVAWSEAGVGSGVEALRRELAAVRASVVGALPTGVRIDLALVSRLPSRRSLVAGLELEGEVIDRWD